MAQHTVTFPITDPQEILKLRAGDEVTVQAGEHGVRFLLLSGAPIREPVAWYGPIVMNTREELRTAVKELQSGSFIKEGAVKG